MAILAIILLVIVAAVSFINTELVSINLYLITLSIPMWGVFVSFLLIGALIIFLLATSKGAHNRQVIKNKNQEIKRVEDEKEKEVRRVRNEMEKKLTQTKKENDLQLELQNRDAEIQKLESKLTAKEINKDQTERNYDQEKLENKSFEHSAGEVLFETEDTNESKITDEKNRESY